MDMPVHHRSLREHLEVFETEAGFFPPPVPISH